MRLPIIALLAATCAAPLQAADTEASMRAFVDETVRPWVTDPLVFDAVVRANIDRAGLSASDVNDLDALWRSEVGRSDRPTIAPVLDSPASQRLRERVAEAGGAVTEVLVMDAHGLNAAVSDVTSDFWQGDEAKFQDTYGVGPDAVHMGEIDFDELTQTYQAQVSFTLVDPSLGTSIGAVTVGLNADAF